MVSIVVYHIQSNKAQVSGSKLLVVKKEVKQEPQDNEATQPADARQHKAVISTLFIEGFMLFCIRCIRQHIHMLKTI